MRRKSYARQVASSMLITQCRTRSTLVTSVPQFFTFIFTFTTKTWRLQSWSVSQTKLCETWGGELANGHLRPEYLGYNYCIRLYGILFEMPFISYCSQFCKCAGIRIRFFSRPAAQVPPRGLDGWPDGRNSATISLHGGKLEEALVWQHGLPKCQAFVSKVNCFLRDGISHSAQSYQARRQRSRPKQVQPTLAYTPNVKKKHYISLYIYINFRYTQICGVQ